MADILAAAYTGYWFFFKFHPSLFQEEVDANMETLQKI